MRTEQGHPAIAVVCILTAQNHVQQNQQEMKRPTIIWDFDGTILPADPYDSEQTLLYQVLEKTGRRLPAIKRFLGKTAIYFDSKGHFASWFKKIYIWLLMETPVQILDRVSKDLSRKISLADRRTLLELKRYGFPMSVLSCGTADLSQRIIELSGLTSCFRRIEGNRFRIEGNIISGFDFFIPNPRYKIRMSMESFGLRADEVVAVGDGYTDFPLLDWAGTSILIDRTGKYPHLKAKYHVISSIPEVVNVLEENGFYNP